MSILFTGFQPFLGDAVNPSQKLAISLDPQCLVLPVVFGESFEILKARLGSGALAFEDRPKYLVMLGLAAGRNKICFEKIGLNWVQAMNPDESGVTPVTGSIVAGQPLALMSRFPVDEAYLDLKMKSLPVEISFSAGSYVCNDLYYRVLHAFPDLKAVFVHVPRFETLDFEIQLKTLQCLKEFLFRRKTGQDV